MKSKQSQRRRKRTVTHDGTTYKVRSDKIEIPDLESMERTAALVWLVRHTYPRGTNHHRPAPNLNFGGAIRVVG